MPGCRPPERLPLALAGLHRSTDVGTPLDLVLGPGPGRHGWEYDRVADLVVGAGFEVLSMGPASAGAGAPIRVRARRLRTLPDTVGPGMRILVCGLNPSVYAADTGVGFARPGNRFWPAALAAGLVTVDRDPLHALEHHGVGMTDLVKRATPGAAGIATAEYQRGLTRVERLAAWLGPAVVCVVGLAGWRAAAGAGARAGVQAVALAGVPVYVMPNTSGRNASATLEGLIGHLRTVVAMAGDSR